MSRYSLEKDGAVKIPESIKKMSLDELKTRCARLARAKQKPKDKPGKRSKVACKTKFAI